MIKGEGYKEGSRNATKPKTGRTKEIVIEDGDEEDVVEEEITIVTTKKVVKKGNKKNKTIVSLRN